MNESLIDKLPTPPKGMRFKVTSCWVDHYTSCSTDIRVKLQKRILGIFWHTKKAGCAGTPPYGKTLAYSIADTARILVASYEKEQAKLAEKVSYFGNY